MARKKQKPPFSPAVVLVAVLIILVLGVFGIQVPDSIQEIFGIHTQQETKPSAPSSSTSTNPGPKELGPATFSASEMADSKKGWIDYHKLDSLGRATGADALLKPAMVNTGTAANKDVRPPGFISGLDPYNHSRGHLIGRQMGGSGDDARNLTTLYQTPVNTPFMTKYENQIRQALDKGETVRYRVTPIYEGTELLCKEIELEAKGLNKNTTIDFRVSILNEK
ncbi:MULTISPECIES: DNA/RNA non-specific endonuclease [unclassified Enterococcus]|uniref:DNA/RNA non-specific endonuclease n=1 Tax=unclassified Enterococcus TaxID=2608891 RepID=UPI001CE03EDF|nr:MULTISPECIES: DNA/RNA non-specific endonuclease [unclassified Enterococcus]MCA5013524.1 DNA/RNA non-specific endonuclease [Enterococcus sp. S23]MCA5016774.1 DNA/RNA non-specific endonuclease [Enterococcus sp. S22(2020)]